MRKNKLSDFSGYLRTLIILFVLDLPMFVSNICATNYYVSATGNDNANGLTPSTPWQTISKFNAAFSSFPVGSTIFFNKGDTFYGTLKITKSGTSGNPITISAYGTGKKPIITGFTTFQTGWTDEGNGIYSIPITSDSLTNMVTLNGKQVGMGRYPDSDFLKYESSTASSITDNELGASINWVGAEIAIRKNNWTLSRCRILTQSGNTLNFKNLVSSDAPSAGFGYFFMNDLKTLTTYGEWFHNLSAKKFYMYFGSVNPNIFNNNIVVNVATLYNIFENRQGGNYITIDNINLTGSINNAIFKSTKSDYCNIQNCDISFCGNTGIDLGDGTGCIVDNNTFMNCNSNGLYSNTTLFSKITNNTFSDIALIPGQSLSKGGISAVQILGNDAIVSYNNIKRTGYVGISVRYTGASTVSYNYIDSVCLVLNDGGGIYMSNAITNTRLIDHNIVINAIGNISGTPGTISMAEGIYLDEYSSNVIVTNNTVANCGNSGIKLHKAHNNIVTDNTTYNCKTGIDIQNSSVIADYIQGISLRRNIFFAKTSSQYLMYFHTTNNDDMTLFGIADSNYYARPMDDNLTFRLSQPALGTIQKSLAAWQTFSHQDANSKKSPITVTDVNDFRFEFNATKSPTTISLGGKYITTDSKVYDGSITLQPYCSVILMKYSTPTAINAIPNSNKPIVNVFPNPVTNELMIEIEANNGKAGFEIIDSSGRSVLKGSLFQKTVVNVSNFAPGFYFLKIELGNSSEIKKIIKI